MTVESQKVGSPRSDEILATIGRDGHSSMAKATAEEKRQILLGLGTTIYVADVTVKPGSKALVTSDRALDYHTDHHRADLIAWFGREKVYYSFWMNRGDLTPERREAFLAFKSLTETEPPIRYHLEPGDLLIIDNGRMLHGRTAIGGNRRRFLKRYWIESLNNQTNYANTTSD